MYHTFFLGFLCFFALVGCGSPEEKVPTVVSVPVPVMTEVEPSDYRCVVIENIDSTGLQHGFGYDIYDGEKKLIHQTNIPGEPGIEGFVSKEEAALIGMVVVEKLNAGQGFPTLTREELISKGITLKQ